VNRSDAAGSRRAADDDRTSTGQAHDNE
jgi:hypothetical protein